MPILTTPDLDIDHADTGPRDGPVVLLVHGWPDDRASWDPVAAALNAAGLRTIVPSLRGFGATRFRSAGTPRTGNSAALALDAIALLDGLGIERFSAAGHDWGASTVEALAVGWPDRVATLALLGTPPRLGGLPTPSFEQARRYWYHWFMATGRGEQAVRRDPRGFARRMWIDWSPAGWFTDELFERTAQAFDNPDWIDVTLHSYRSRWEEAEPDPRSRWLHERVQATASLAVPTLFFQGEEDGVNPPSLAKGIEGRFSGPFETVSLPGVGHFTQREAPREVAARLIRHVRGGR